MNELLRGAVVNPEKVYGKSAYEIAVSHGFNGTEEEWVEHLETSQSEAVKEASEKANKDIADARKAMLSDLELAADIVQNVGNSQTAVMSQNAVTDELYNGVDIDLSQYDFKQGALASGRNDPNVNSRCSTYNHISVTDTSKLYVAVNAGYKVEVDFYRSDKTYISYKGWIEKSETVEFPQGTEYIKIAVAYTNNAVITPADAVGGVSVVLNINKLVEDIKRAAERNIMRVFIPINVRESFYVEFDNSLPSLYIKFDELRVRGYANGQWVAKNYTTESLATECNETLVTSRNGVEGCLQIVDEKGLLFDFDQQKFQIEHRREIPNHKKLPIIICESGHFAYCHSSLLETYTDNENKKLEAKIEEIKANAEENEIPAYWESAVSTAESKVEKHQNDGGVNTFTFGFIADTHVTATSEGIFAPLMKRVMDSCDIPLFLHGGDIVQGIGVIPKDELITQIKRHKEIFKNIEDKCLLAFGNHDSAFGVSSSWDSALTDGEIYNYIFRKDQLKNDIVFGETGRYFYKDVPAQNVRYIVLDCYDFKTTLIGNTVATNNKMFGGAKFGAKQIEWLANAALKVPEGYSVVICSHQPPYRSSDKNAIGWSGEDVMLDAEVVIGIVNAFRNKTTVHYYGELGWDASKEDYAIDFDFTDYNGDFVCWVAGHTHKDYIFDLDGLKVVNTANCSTYRAETNAEFSPIKAWGTDTEHIIDFLCVNKSTRMCNIVRLGAELEGNAAGRSFTY